MKAPLLSSSTVLSKGAFSLLKHKRKRRRRIARTWYIGTNGKNILMRSRWEVAYAQYLDRQNIKWKYEPKKFLIGTKKHYIPDFYLTASKTYVEIKGRMTIYASRKHEAFRKNYPTKKWVLLQSKELTALGVIKKGCAVLN